MGPNPALPKKEEWLRASPNPSKGGENELAG